MRDQFKTYIVGYDARVSFDECREHWGSERRKAYLYKEDSLVPLSTDLIVWERAFEPEPEELPFTGHQLLWTSFLKVRSLTKHHANIPTESENAIAIEIILHQDDRDEISQWQELNVPVEPISLETGWKPLGYDVSDRWLLSGLSNCGFLPECEDVDLLKQKWHRYLNEHHLFSDVINAFEFKIFSDARVAEHAPFFVYKLWLFER